MEVRDYYQERAAIILIRNALQIEKDGNKPEAWDGWLAQVLFAQQLHVLRKKDYAKLLSRYAEHLP